jgi:hypothetical protein
MNLTENQYFQGSVKIMTLATLLTKYKASDIEPAFKILFSCKDVGIGGFPRVYQQLLSLKSEVSDSVIHMEWEKEWLDGESLDDMHVHTYQKGEKPLESNGFEYYDASYQDWSWWLGCDIDEAILNDVSEQEIICHIIWEMTFLGSTPVAIVEKREAFEKACNEKGERIESVDEFFRLLDEENIE